jgi:hypothetical protein
MMTSLDMLRGAEAEFRDSVRDDFGRSIVEDVFQPVAAELRVLEELDGEIRRVIHEIDARAEEARLII